MRDLHNKLKIGVVLSKKEYAYTTGRVGSVLDAIYYTYGNSNWGDLLTIYDGKSITYDAWGNVLTTGGSMSSALGLRNPLRYRGYVYDIETKLYYLQSRYYNPQWGRFLNADAFATTGQGTLGNNMFVYCLNNPVNMVDFSGNSSVTFDNPYAQLDYEIGQWIYNWLKEETEEDKAKIADGTVNYIGKGPGKGAEITNSYEIDTPWVMYQYVSANRGDEIMGTTTGFVVEWVFHNIAYDIGTALRLDSIVLSAKDVAVGKTIFSDSRPNFSMEMLMSMGMKIAYTVFSPISAVYDLYVEYWR